MAKLSRRLIISWLGLLILSGLLFLLGRIPWEMHRLKQMCAELRPGTAVADIPSTAKKYGFWNPLVEYAFEHEGRQRPTVGERTVWEIDIAAPSTIGDMQCLILHDESAVLTAKVVGP